jgi:hypothetical protein
MEWAVGSFVIIEYEGSELSTVEKSEVSDSVLQLHVSKRCCLAVLLPWGEMYLRAL